jgi:hypothetical protein
MVLVPRVIAWALRSHMGGELLSTEITRSPEVTVIGPHKGQQGRDNKAGKVLVLATTAEVGVDVDGEDCSPTGQSYPGEGQALPLALFPNFPSKLQRSA